MTPPAGLTVGLLGLRELPAQPVQLGLLVERHAEGPLAKGVDSRWRARRIACIASSQAPRNCSTWDRCTRH